MVKSVNPIAQHINLTICDNADDAIAKGFDWKTEEDAFTTYARAFGDRTDTCLVPVLAIAERQLDLYLAADASRFVLGRHAFDGITVGFRALPPAV